MEPEASRHDRFLAIFERIFPPFLYVILALVGIAILYSITLDSLQRGTLQRDTGFVIGVLIIVLVARWIINRNTRRILKWQRKNYFSHLAILLTIVLIPLSSILILEFIVYGTIHRWFSTFTSDFKFAVFFVLLVIAASLAEHRNLLKETTRESRPPR